MRILLVEDDALLAGTLAASLEDRYIVDRAATGGEAIRLAQENDYDLVILDLGLPDRRGVDVCRSLRQAGLAAPILILTGEHTDAAKVEALDAGADDYLTKPFSHSELSARLRALLRRAAPPPAPALTVADLRLDPAQRRVSRAGKVIRLRRKEYDILECLMRNAGSPVPRSRLMEQAWDKGAELFTNTVDVHIKHLRDKVDKPFRHPLIKTVYGVGYKIDA